MDGDTVELLVLWNFTSENADEMDCEAAEVIFGIELRGEWWYCENQKGERGLVPANYVQVGLEEDEDGVVESDDSNPFDNDELDATNPFSNDLLEQTPTPAAIAATATAEDVDEDMSAIPNYKELEERFSKIQTRISSVKHNSRKLIKPVNTTTTIPIDEAPPQAPTATNSASAGEVPPKLRSKNLDNVRVQGLLRQVSHSTRQLATEYISKHDEDAEDIVNLLYHAQQLQKANKISLAKKQELKNMILNNGMEQARVEIEKASKKTTPNRLPPSPEDAAKTLAAKTAQNRKPPPSVAAAQMQHQKMLEREKKLRQQQQEQQRMLEAQKQQEQQRLEDESRRQAAELAKKRQEEEQRREQLKQQQQREQEQIIKNAERQRQYEQEQLAKQQQERAKAVEERKERLRISGAKTNAVEAIKNAVAADNGKRYAEAYVSYCLALDLFALALDHEQFINTSTVLERMEGYLTRISILEPLVCDAARCPAGASPAPRYKNRVATLMSMMHAGYNTLQPGVDLHHQARAFDTQGDYVNALQKYAVALDHIMAYYKFQKAHNKEVNKLITDSIKSMLDRAEELKELVPSFV